MRETVDAFKGFYIEVCGYRILLGAIDKDFEPSFDPRQNGSKVL